MVCQTLGRAALRPGPRLLAAAVASAHAIRQFLPAIPVALGQDDVPGLRTVNRSSSTAAISTPVRV